MNSFKQFLGNESGATAIEYGLIAALISIAAILIMGSVGDSLNNTFAAVNNGLKP